MLYNYQSTIPYLIRNFNQETKQHIGYFAISQENNSITYYSPACVLQKYGWKSCQLFMTSFTNKNYYNTLIIIYKYFLDLKK